MDFSNASEDKRRAALEAIDLAKAQILADNHFLSTAVGRPKIVSDAADRLGENDCCSQGSGVGAAAKVHFSDRVGMGMRQAASSPRSSRPTRSRSAWSPPTDPSGT